MPVKFTCPNCRSLLRVTRRKIGVTVECPTCGEPSVVPEQSTTSTKVPPNRSSKSVAAKSAKQSAADEPFDEVLAVFESLEHQAEPARRSRQQVSPRESAARRKDVSHAPFPLDTPVPVSVSRRPGVDARQLVVLPRRMIYLQAACIPLLLAIGLVVGYLIGRSHATVVSPAATENVPFVPKYTEPEPAGSEPTGSDTK